MPVATLKVDLPEPPDGTVTGLGENLHALLEGQPVTEKVTLPLKVFSDFRVSVYLAVPPWSTDVAVGLEEMEKGTITTRLTDTMWLRLLFVPVTARLYVPLGAVPLVLAVKVEVAVPRADTVTEGALRVQVMLEGQLLLRSTVPLNPFSEVTVTV